MASGIQVSSEVILMVLDVLAKCGLDVEQIVREVGLQSLDRDDRDGWVSLEQEEALWRLGTELTGEPAFGLVAAEVVTPGGFEMIEYLMSACTTFGEAVDVIARFNRLTHESAEITLTSLGSTSWITHRFSDPNRRPIREAAEFTFGYMVRTIRGLTQNREWRPSEVWFDFDAPDDLAPYHAAFGVRVHFAREERRIVFDRSLLDTPMQTADPKLARILRKHAESVLQSLPKGSTTWLDQFRDVLAHELAGGDPTIQVAADALHTSVRTLQRHLAEHDVTFQSELETMREALARRYLVERSMSVAEVAYLLGYSEPSAFHRAFKRWTGTTPGAFRKK